MYISFISFGNIAHTQSLFVKEMSSDLLE